MAQIVSKPRHLPWWKILLVAGLPALILMFGLGRIVGESNNPVGSGPSLPAMVRAIETPTPTPTPTPMPTTTAWSLVQVTWILVTDLSILPPAEEGFYNGTMQNEVYGSSGTTEWAAYARNILPELLNPFPGAKQAASVARDSINKNVVLAGLALALPPTGEPSAHLFLSLDGENTWREISLPAGRFEKAIVLPWAIRVVSHDNSITLFFLAGGGGDGRWHQATLPQ